MTAAETIPCIDADAEARYLAACMHDDAVLERHPVWPREMGVRTHALILEAMQAARAAGHGTDHVSIAVRLKSAGQLERIGGERALRAIGSVVELHPGPLARHLRTLAVARGVRESAMRAATLAEHDLAEALRTLRVAAEAVHPDEGSRERFGSLREAVESAYEELAERTKRNAGRTRPAYVTTGIRTLDEHIGGWEYGDLIVLGGDTSVGKSTTALYTLCEMAKAGHRPGIISCEDPAARVGRRAISMLSGVPSVAIRKGDLSPWQWEALSGSVAKVGDLEVNLAFCIGEDVDVITEATRTLIKERGCDVILLDYVQAVRVPGMEERLAMREVLSRFKRECNRACPAALGIVLSQFKRRPDVTQRPARSDLYESGYLEQKADGIVLLWKDADGLLNGVLDKAKDDETGIQFSFARKGGVFVEV
jgi:replicative DNA helicase